MPAVEELLLDCLAQFLTEDEKDRLVGLHLGVSLQVEQALAMMCRCSDCSPPSIQKFSDELKVLKLPTLGRQGRMCCS